MSSLSPMFQLHLLAAPGDLPLQSPPETPLAALSADAISRSLMAVTFEELADRLQACDRVHFEMDGSFVWTGCDHDAQAWQLDGMVYDLHQRVQRIELKGRCPRGPWQTLLSAIDYPAQALLAYDLKSGLFTTLVNLETHLWRG